nr:MYB transcription factor protein [Rosa persica]
MAPHIPFEVITEILAKLLVKSLLKFRVVCKSWCSLISTSQFVRKHLLSNTGTSKKVIQLSRDVLTFYSLHDFKLVQETIEFQIECNALSSFRIMGYCDGLVCVEAYRENRIFLWNPSTRDSKILPCGVVDNSYFSWCRFGYDYNSDDYKVLTVDRLKTPIDNYQDSSRNSMMYTLRTNSWRRIQDFPLQTSYMMVDSSAATHVNGALHWMARQGLNSWVIFSLDLTTETNMEVPQPDFYGTPVEHIGIGASSTRCLGLTVHNGAGSQCYDFWVMKEYRVQESWTISLKIPYMVVGIYPRPVAWFSENGKILFNRDGKLATYNAKKKNSVRYLHQTTYSYSCPHGDVYVESLVSPNAYSNREAKEISRLNNINVERTTRVVMRASKKIRKPKPWKHPQPITKTQLLQLREEFWDTAPHYGGRKEIWDALRAAAEADLSLAQAIVDSAGVIVQSADLTICYDERGAKYELPKYVLSEPTNLIRES